jgi:site-specific recombinase XerD
VAACPHKAKGQKYSLCPCPIWAYGTLNGEPFRQSLHTNDADVAEQRRLALIHGSGDALITLRDAKAPRLATAVEQYIATCRDPKRNLAEGTANSYEHVLSRFAADTRGQIPITAITHNVLENYAQTRQISPGTWRKELQILRTFFCWTIEQKGWLERTPVKLRTPPLPELVTLPFTETEADALIWATSQITSRYVNLTSQFQRVARAVVLTLFYTGLRISDVAMLRRSALDHQSGHLALRVIKTGVPIKIQLKPVAQSALESLPVISTNPDYFFWNGVSKPSAVTAMLASMIRRLGKMTGIHAHPHRFRDTFAVVLLEEGEDIRNVQKLLGHKSVRTTELHYAHHSPKQQQLLDRATASLHFGQRQTAGPVAVQPLQHRGRTA